MKGLGGLGGWAWIFLIEGIFSKSCSARRAESLTPAPAAFVLALFAPFLIDDFPEQSKFLTPEEKTFVVQRLAEDHGAAGEAPFAWSHITSAFSDWRVWVYALIYIGVAEPLYSVRAEGHPTPASRLAHSRFPSSLCSRPPF